MGELAVGIGSVVVFGGLTLLAFLSTLPLLLMLYLRQIRTVAREIGDQGFVFDGTVLGLLLIPGVPIVLLPFILRALGRALSAIVPGPPANGQVALGGLAWMLYVATLLFILIGDDVVGAFFCLLGVHVLIAVAAWHLRVTRRTVVGTIEASGP